MKKRIALLSLPLILVLVVALVVAGCGSGTSSTTTSGAATTASTAGASTTVSGPASTTSESGSSTTAAGGTTTTAAAGGVPNNIVVQLTGDEEVPPVKTAATGTFTLMISMGSTGSTDSTAASSGGGLLPPGLAVSYKLEVSNITDATAAHIHLGAKGQNGEVIYPLFTGPQKNGAFSGVLAEGPLTENNLTGSFKGKTFADLVQAVLSGGCYVNVHTAANPNGEIRGQIIINLGGTTGSTEPGGATGTTATAAGSTASTSASGY